MKRFKNILCVAAAEEACRPTLERAVSLAENNQAQLTVAMTIPQADTAIGDEAWQILQAFTKPYRERLAIQHEALIGADALQIIRLVLRYQHDLVMKPAENPDFIEKLLGNNDMHLLRQCPCPVWLTKPGETANYRCILVAVDFDPVRSNSINDILNEQIIEMSTSLALSDFADLHLVHVWDTIGEVLVRTWASNPVVDSISYVEGEQLGHQQGLDRLRDQLKARIGAEAYDYLAPRFHLRRGEASSVIPETALRLQADLVVMGTVARTGIAGWLIGNTAEAVLQQLRCSVLAIKPSGFVSPVTLEQNEQKPC